ncbi:hypothetical protein ACIBF7_24415 [Nonomuraea sp. NPDC050478]|uniref:Uncharacterized protein n=1 Tax=Nonomuraea harbinensis TaxID=1286938 RepID=A0ABW1BV78_9ACTN
MKIPTEDQNASGEKAREAVGMLRMVGTALLLTNGGLAIAALVFADWEPPFQVLLLFICAAAIGIGLRIEAAMRDRR